jgi:hypothetical protein
MGKYSTTEGATSSQACLECMPGTYQSSPGLFAFHNDILFHEKPPMKKKCLSCDRCKFFLHVRTMWDWLLLRFNWPQIQERMQTMPSWNVFKCHSGYEPFLLFGLSCWYIFLKPCTGLCGKMHPMPFRQLFNPGGFKFVIRLHSVSAGYLLQ